MENFGDTTCGDLASIIRPILKRQVKYLVALLTIAAAEMVWSNQPGVPAFALVAFGSLLPLFAWLGGKQCGLPLAAMLGLQTLLFYATPIFVQNPAVFDFGVDAVTTVSMEIFLFGLALAGGWMIAVRNARTKVRPTIHRFVFLDSGGNERLANLGPAMLGFSFAFLLANQLRWVGILPGGIFPIVRAIADAAGIGGGLIGGYCAGTKVLTGAKLWAFWLIITAHCLLIASNYTLFPAVSLLLALLIGIFLGRGRVPLIPMVIVGLAFAFLNLSKFDMRKRYWIEGEAYAAQELTDLPDRFSEWAELSWDALMLTEDSTTISQGRTKQQVSDRINNLVNLLDARKGIVAEGIEPFGGGSYTIIPVLLIPRFLWPDKPRTHEGMVALNIHFGRQTREESLTTYISWGLLPEAYANFGPIFGALACGLMLGAGAGMLEMWGRQMPLASMEALVFLSLTVHLGTSFEMVASVWITSMFQMVTALVIGTFLFVKRTAAPAHAL